LALSEEGLIDDALLVNQINKNGLYGFNAYVRGIPTIVTVDDVLPYSYMNN